MAGFGFAFGNLRRRRPLAGITIPPSATNITVAQLNANVAAAGGIAIEAYIGASRFSHGVFSNNGQMSKRAAGQWVWASILRPNVRGPAWFDAGYTSTINYPQTNGFYFCQDGTGYAEIIARLDKFMASDAHIGIINSPLSNVGATSVIDGSAYSAAGYVAVMQFIVDYCIAANALLPAARRKFLIVDDLWERGSAAGGFWSVGNAGRLSVPTVITLMQAMLDQRNIPMIPVRTGIMRLSDGHFFPGIIDTAGTYTPNCEPIPGITRTDTSVSAPAQSGDGTHLSNIGGKRYGDIKDTLYENLGICPRVRVADPARAGNLMTNAMLTGTGGAVSGANISGSLATSYTVARAPGGSSTTASIVNLSKVSKVPTDTVLFGSAALTWQQIDIDTSANSISDREGINITQTADITGLQNGQYYEPYLIFEAEAWDGWRGYDAYWASPNTTLSTRTASSTLTSVNAGGSLVGGMDVGSLPMPGEAITGQMIGNPFKANGTTAQFRFTLAWTKAAGVGRIRITGIELRLVSNPAVSAANSYPDTLMYDESLPASATIMSPAAFTVTEEEDFALQLTADKGGVWSLGGTDINAAGTAIAQFSVANSPPTKGRIKPVSGKLDYEIPTDANSDNVYALTVTFTPFDKRIAAVNQAVSITVTDVNDGFTDQMTTAFAANLPLDQGGLWGKYAGSSDGLQYRGDANGIKMVNTTASLYYPVAQQGDTVQQQIRFIQTISTTGGGMCGPLALDFNNGLVMRGFTASGTASSVTISRRQGGSFTSQVVFTGYKAPAVGDQWICQILNISGVYTLQLFQNGVPCTVASGSADVTALVTGGGFLASARKPAIGSLFSNANPWMKGFNNRVASAIVPKVGLLGLVFDSSGTATLSGQPAGVPGVASISSKKTAGSVPSISNIRLGGVVQADQTIFFADGGDIRWTGAQASGTWTFDVIEALAGAVNDGRSTTMTVVVS